MKCSGPHKSTWQPFYKAVTSPWLIRELFEKHWGMLCLITILVKWCLTSLTMPSGAGADTFSRGGCTCLIKNKKVAMLFMQLTSIYYPESQLGGCVCYWSTLHTHTHYIPIPTPCNYFALSQLWWTTTTFNLIKLFPSAFWPTGN